MASDNGRADIVSGQRTTQATPRTKANTLTGQHCKRVSLQSTEVVRQ